MTMTISGDGSITGLAAGGLPDSSIVTADIADSNVTPAKLSQKLTSGTAVASTSGTSIGFTGIPSWVKRITLMLNGVSTNGAFDLIVQVGNGSTVTTGYSCQGVWWQSSSGYSANSSYTNRISNLNSNTASDTKIGQVVLTNISGNTWVATSQCATVNTVYSVSSGSITLSSSLDRVILLASNGTDTFDAGTVNIMYE